MTSMLGNDDLRPKTKSTVTVLTAAPVGAGGIEPWRPKGPPLSNGAPPVAISAPLPRRWTFLKLPSPRPSNRRPSKDPGRRADFTASFVAV
jgi:hypothetical protein